MSDPFPDPAHGAPRLLTPGPITTLAEVKQALLGDWIRWIEMLPFGGIRDSGDRAKVGVPEAMTFFPTATTFALTRP